MHAIHAIVDRYKTHSGLKSNFHGKNSWFYARLRNSCREWARDYADFKMKGHLDDEVGV